MTDTGIFKCFECLRCQIKKTIKMEKTLSVFIIVFAISLTSSISTVHYDKSDSVSISSGQGTTTDSPISSTVRTLANVTLSLSERKKRLLPYQNFYFNQPFNRPHQAGVSAQQYKDYEDSSSINKKPEYEPARPKDVFYHPSQKFTPFLESNALPGHFRPMAAGNNINPHKIQFTFVNVQPGQEETFLATKGHVQTDFGAIYDKLSQLKLRQQELHNKAPYGHRLISHHRFHERPQKLQEYRPSIFDSPTRYKINPSKTTFETFTATNIDIPDSTEEEKYEFQPPRHHKIPTPTKEQFSMPVHNNYRENTKPFIRHQIAIEVPQSRLPLTFSPSLVRKPLSGKDRPSKPPYIFIQQGKPDAKQPVLILRKPKPVVVVDENFVAEKYTPQGPSKYHYHHRPIFTAQEHQYPPAPVYENDYAIPYEATPAPIELNQEEYQRHVTPSSFNLLEYGAKLAPEPQKDAYQSQNDYGAQNAEQQRVKYEQVEHETPQKVEYEHQKVEYEPVLISSTPQYEDNKYYQYQTVTSGPTTVSPNNYNFVKQKLLPQDQGDVAYRAPQQPHFENTGGASNPLSAILKQLQESNTLPQTLTPDNIDNSIKTLVKILNALRDRQKQHKPVPVQDHYGYENEAGVDLEVDLFDTPDGGTPGKPGVDYPALSTIPKTNFNCKTQRYKGFFGDPDTNCQVWHYCDLNGGQASFLCPNGTIFSQVALTCDWWYNVKCSSTAQLYVLNERLYKYIIPLSPKFPEDYSGPLVDKYLAMKFQEMEEKLRKQKKGKGNDSNEDDENSGDEEEEEDEPMEETESSTTEPVEVTTKTDPLYKTDIHTTRQVNYTQIKGQAPPSLQKRPIQDPVPTPTPQITLD